MATVTEIETQIEAAYQRAHNELRAHAVAEYRRLAGPNAGMYSEAPTPNPVDPLQVLDAAEWSAIVTDELRPLFNELFLAVLEGSTADIPAAVRTIMLDAHLEAIDKHGATLSADVARILRTANDEGWSVARTAEALDTAPTLGESSAVAVARTELIAAANGASYLGAGEWATKEWIATNDDRTRHAHANADGQRVAFEDMFEVGGERCMYPGDPSLSAAQRVNCRCTLIYDDEPADTYATKTRQFSFSVTQNRTEQGAAMPDTLTGLTADMTYEGVYTGDGRYIEPGALTAAQSHSMLMGTSTTSWGHNGASVMGSFGTVERHPGDVWRGTASLSTDPEAQRLARLVAEGHLTGISVDLGSCDYYYDVDPRATKPEGMDEWEWLVFEAPYVCFITSAIIEGATICPFPAFTNARAKAFSTETMEAFTSGEKVQPMTVQARINASQTGGLITATMHDVSPRALLASGGLPASMLPPSSAFAKRTYTRATPVKFDGKFIYGHVAPWNRPHIVYSSNGGKLIYPPRSTNDYRLAANKPTPLADGGYAYTMPLTVNGGNHCEPNDALSGQQVRQWYESHPAVGDVAIYEDEFGIQIAGYVREGCDPKALREAVSSDWSPDWREERYGMECYGIVAVPVSGFVTEAASSNDPRTGRALVASGRSLVHFHQENGAERIRAMFGGGSGLRNPKDAMLAALARDMRDIKDRLARDLDPLAAAAALAELKSALEQTE